MAYIRCDYSSQMLKMNTSMIVLLPDLVELSEIDVVYLLHGLTDNCTGWTRFSAVERYAREHGVAVIMPEVQRSFYTDMELGVNYFSYILKELPEFCHRTFGLSRKREHNFIMGLSMGGYGALKCAFTAPEQFAGCASFSAVTDIAGRVERAPQCEKDEFQAIFGEQLKVPESCDLFALARKASPEAMPRLFMTCGEQDTLYPENVRLAQMLKAGGFNASFDHWEGVHSWDFWDRSVKMAMDALLPQANG
ncbi:MAG: hypothetical protein J6J18_09875 [Oscillospiraceae bacterium]|nr:hypothetical protein [Oscillospiraceae bacterium]